MQCLIHKSIEFDAGHRVPNHKSKCRNPHGHRYKVTVWCKGNIIETEGASDEGMLVDFGDLKHYMMEYIHDVLDHGFIVYKHDTQMLEALACGTDWKIIYFPYIPTAENLAIWIWNELVKRLAVRFKSDLVLCKVEVYETPTSVAIYEGG